MALFGGIRDARFLAAVNSELINAIIDTEIEFFKLIVESSNSNIYGESESKSYFDSILIPCIITKEGKNAVMDDYGHSYTRTAQFAISRDLLFSGTMNIMNLTMLMQINILQEKIQKLGLTVKTMVTVFLLFVMHMQHVRHQRALKI
jgi:hypothetical protein